MSWFSTKTCNKEDNNNPAQHQMLPRKRHANLSPPPPNGRSVFRIQGRSGSFDHSNGKYGVTFVGRARSSENAETNTPEERTRARTALHASFDSSLFDEEGCSGVGTASISSKKRSNLRRFSERSEEDTMGIQSRLMVCRSEGDGDENSGLHTPFRIIKSSDCKTRLYMTSQNQMARNNFGVRGVGCVKQSIGRNGELARDKKIAEISTSSATGKRASEIQKVDSRDRITPTDLKSELILTASEEEQERNSDGHSIMASSNISCSVGRNVEIKDLNSRETRSINGANGSGPNKLDMPFCSNTDGSIRLKIKSPNDVNISAPKISESRMDSLFSLSSNNNEGPNISTGPITAQKPLFMPLGTPRTLEAQAMQPPPTPLQRRPIKMKNMKTSPTATGTCARIPSNRPINDIRLASNHHISNTSWTDQHDRDHVSLPPPANTPLQTTIVWNENRPPNSLACPLTENSCNAKSISTLTKPSQRKSDELVATPPQQRECHAMDGPLDSQGTQISVDSLSSSVSSHLETPFRFSSFPASLPRVNPRSSSAPVTSHNNHCAKNSDKTPPRDIRREVFQSPFLDNRHIKTSANSLIPGTVRKRMVFSQHDGDENQIIPDSLNIDSENLPQHHGPSQGDCLNTSTDDSQNTSMSSLSVDGTTPNVLPSRKASLDSGTTSRAVWLSPAMNDEKGQIMSDKKSSSVAVIPKNDGVRHNEPIMMQDGRQKMDLRDASKVSLSHGGTADKVLVGTRLNFNSLRSPNPPGSMEGFRDCHQGDTDEETTPICNSDESLKKTMNPQHDITQPYVPIRTCSFPSVSTDTPGCNTSEALASGDDTLNTANGGFIPFQFGSGVELNTTNTREEDFRLHLDSTQCSPIAKVEKDVELQGTIEGRSIDKNGVSPMTDTQRGHDLTNENSEGRRKADDTAEKLKDNQSRQQEVWNSSSRTPSPQKSTVGELSLQHSGHSSVMSGSSNASTARKLRPMPDMSAFDIGSSTTVSSLQNAESCGAIICSPSKILCPPTPVRTPAWAHNGGLARKNSLITTKILADCAPQTLDELSSFETSIIEDEKNVSQYGESNYNSLLLSFLAVREESESRNTSGESGALYKSTPQYDMYGNGTRKRRNSRASLKSIKNVVGFDTEMAIDDTPVKVSKPGRSSTGLDEVGSATISFESDFENIGCLGSGSFADVFKARSKANGSLYAVKRNRRQFRGKRDRDLAMAEVRIMQRLQSSASTHERSANNICLYVLNFIRAWQEDGHLFCQTELCCKDTCKQLRESLTTNWESSSKKYPSLIRNFPASCHDKCGHLIPENTIWKIFHDVTEGLSHIHSHGIVHQDIKPVNILFVSHQRLGALCKIGDFGMAGDVGTIDDGQEGDTMYMPQELLNTTPVKDPSGDIFSLGLTMYELSSSGAWTLPTEGVRWHDIRNGSHVPELSPSRSNTLIDLIQKMISPDKDQRPNASETLISNKKINAAGMEPDRFLSDYINDVQRFDLAREKELILAQQEADKSRHTPTPLVSRRNTSRIE